MVESSGFVGGGAHVVVVGPAGVVVVDVVDVVGADPPHRFCPSISAVIRSGLPPLANVACISILKDSPAWSSPSQSLLVILKFWLSEVVASPWKHCNSVILLSKPRLMVQPFVSWSTVNSS